MIIHINNNHYLIGLTWLMLETESAMMQEFERMHCDGFLVDTKRGIAAGVSPDLSLNKNDVIGAISLAAVVSELSKDAIYVFPLASKSGEYTGKYWLCSIKNGIVLPTALLPVTKEIESKISTVNQSHDHIQLSGDMIVDEGSLHRFLLYLEKVFSSNIFRQVLHCDKDSSAFFINKIESDFGIDRTAIKKSSLTELLLNVPDQQRFCIKPLLKNIKKIAPKKGTANKKSLPMSRRKLIGYGVLLLSLMVGGYMYFFNDSPSQLSAIKGEDKIKKQQEKEEFFNKINSEINNKNAYPLIIKFINAISNLPVSILQWHIQKVYYDASVSDTVDATYVLSSKDHIVSLTQASFNSIQSLQVASVTAIADNITSARFKFISDKNTSKDQSTFNLNSAGPKGHYRFDKFIEELKLRGMNFNLAKAQVLSYELRKHPLTILGQGMRELLSIAAMAKELNTFVLVSVEIQNHQNTPISWVVKGEVYEA
ncbi:hypothetical protein [Fastidiosibacter lacustris]|uniref:hypothetical protein n=1 Tax=Fastidiosibacter lacustris TaxID=2056695 RepID=UPI000E34E00B|nr:hypothetical protein [Fastidiosibacter lacustris]